MVISKKNPNRSESRHGTFKHFSMVHATFQWHHSSPSMAWMVSYSPRAATLIRQRLTLPLWREKILSASQMAHWEQLGEARNAKYALWHQECRPTPCCGLPPLPSASSHVALSYMRGEMCSIGGVLRCGSVTSVQGNWQTRQHKYVATSI